MLEFHLENIIALNKIATVLVATGTILSIFSLEISPSPLEETFVNGKPKKTALVEVIRPKLLKVGVLLLIGGSLMQIIFSVNWGGREK